MNRIHARAICTAILATATATAQATNGDHMLGVNAIHWGMAGAITAAADDAGTVLANPAALANIDMREARVDLGFGLLNPPRAVNGQDSDSNLYLMPAGALAFRVSDRLTTGLGLGGLMGMGVDIADALPAAPGNQAVVTTRQVFKIAPAFSYRLRDDLALGAALNIDVQSLAMYNAQFQLPQTQVFGFGAALGLVWRPSAQWQLGVAYTSEQAMQEFEWHTSSGKYGMTLDLPAQLAAGAAWRPAQGWLIAADVKRIAFSKVLDAVPFYTPGGETTMNFGWSDQTVFALAVQKQLSETTTVRAGVNYGASPIGPEDVNNNLGSLAVTEKHAAIGLTRTIGERTAMSLAYAHAFKNEVPSSTGAPNTIELEQNILSVQISYSN